MLSQFIQERSRPPALDQTMGKGRTAMAADVRRKANAAKEAKALGRRSKKPRRLPRRGLRRAGLNQSLRVPTTSISTRRFFARPSVVLLSATGCFSPLPSV